MSSVSYVRAEAAGHIAVLPAAGAWTTSGGERANPLLSDHYPLFTTCKVCARRIWLPSLMQMEWWHAPDGAPSASVPPPADGRERPAREGR